MPICAYVNRLEIQPLRLRVSAFIFSKLPIILPLFFRPFRTMHNYTSL